LATSPWSNGGFGFGDIALSPLFASEFIDFLRLIMLPERHVELVLSIIIAAREPTAERVGIGPSWNQRSFGRQ
jgi:hypothetical protein